jgi:hypothetical protein
MTMLVELPESSNTTVSPQLEYPAYLPRNRAGEIKRRFTWQEKVRILDPQSSIMRTTSRLKAFRKLFAYRYSDAIITRPGQGPRAWTALRGPIGSDHVIRHLLADRIPTLPPQWIGARSFITTQFVCIDVDANRTPEQTLADKYDFARMDEGEQADLLKQMKPPKPKPPFEARYQGLRSTDRPYSSQPVDLVKG